MHFLTGIQMMPLEDQKILLAQLNAITPEAVLWSRVLTQMVRFKEAVTRITRNIFVRGVSGEATDRNPGILEEKIASERARVDNMGKEAVATALHSHFVRLAGVCSEASQADVAAGIVKKAAVSLGLKPEAYADIASLESAVYERCIEEMISQLKERLRGLSSEEYSRLEKEVEGWLHRLSAADRKTIQEALHLEDLSGKALLSILQSGSSAAAAQMLVSSAGFGAYLFLTTIIHGLGLVTGTTFAFSTYAAATQGLAFLLSGPFLLLVTAASGWLAVRKIRQSLDGYLAQVLVLMGRTALSTR